MKMLTVIIKKFLQYFMEIPFFRCRIPEDSLIFFRGTKYQKSVLPVYRFVRKKRVTDQITGIQIFSVHINCTDLVIVISCIIVDSAAGIAAGSIKCDLILPIGHLTAATLLVNRA